VQYIITSLEITRLICFGIPLFPLANIWFILKGTVLSYNHLTEVPWALSQWKQVLSANHRHAGRPADF